MIKRMLKGFVVAFVFLLGLNAANADDINIYFGPKGGFSPVNNSRKLVFSDNISRKATLSNSIKYAFDKLEPGSTAKIAMYSMSDYGCLDAMIKAASDKNVKVLLLLDGVTSWAKESRDKIANVIEKGAIKAKEDGKPFDFTLAAVTDKAMKRNKREATLDDGTVIYGTMHEKFGIFYAPDNPVPHSCFNGSANISVTSDQIYGENRVFFDNQPAVARQLAEEFARLWNEYSEVVFGEWIPEKYIEASPVPGYTGIVFNSEPKNELELTRIDSELISMIGRVKPEGSLDLGMFSLTRTELAEAILLAAARNPNAKFRLLLDHAQLNDEDPKEGKLGPWLEKQAKERNISNIQVRYRFRKNAYGYDSEKKKVGLISYLSLFWHHKNLCVNNNELAVGSYNWSNSGEFLNFENVMFFNALYEHNQKIIDAFKAEFEHLWNSEMSKKMADGPKKGEPQTVTLAEGKALHNKMIKLLSNKNNQRVHSALDREAFKTYDELKKETKLSDKNLKKALNNLVSANVIVKYAKKDVEGYSQAD